MSDLGVVIVNYNAGEHLLRCVESLVTHAGEAEVEVVVVDNASRDGSIERIREAHPSVTLIQNQDNRGFASAANQGIRAAVAPYLFVLNPDAEISAGTLSRLIKLAGDRPRAAAIGPLVRDSDGSLYPSARKVPTIAEAVGHAFLHPFDPDNRFSRAYTMADWDRQSELEVSWVSGSCVLLRRAALEEVGLFDEGYFMYAEDADLCTRLRRAGWAVLFTPELEVTHERGVSTGNSKRMIRVHSESIYRYFEKHHAAGWKRVLLPFARVALRARAELVIRRRRAT
ncbi:MAG: glycosyltransferase family 2 protein [Actinomycetota bacterium]